MNFPNLVPRAHVPFGQHQDTELWNNQFPDTKILGLPVSWRMRGLVYMTSKDKVNADTFHKGIQYALGKLGKSKFGFERTAVSNFKSKRHEGSGNELVDYSRAPCLGADQKARGLWERDWNYPVNWETCNGDNHLHPFRSEIIILLLIVPLITEKNASFTVKCSLAYQKMACCKMVEKRCLRT